MSINICLDRRFLFKCLKFSIRLHLLINIIFPGYTNEINASLNPITCYFLFKNKSLNTSILVRVYIVNVQLTLLA